VAVGSFSVHLAIMSNTTWVKKFLNGAPAATATVEAPTKVSLAPPEAK
jgi:light-harvesting protein B-800-850 alpha chain